MQRSHRQQRTDWNSCWNKWCTLGWAEDVTSSSTINIRLMVHSDIVWHCWKSKMTWQFAEPHEAQESFSFEKQCAKGNDFLGDIDGFSFKGIPWIQFSIPLSLGHKPKGMGNTKLKTSGCSSTLSICYNFCALFPQMATQSRVDTCFGNMCF